MPGTIALRNILLVVGFVFSLLALNYQKRQILYINTYPVWLLIFFFLWLGIHLLFFSNDFTAQLKELTSVWTRAFLAIPIGFLTGITLTQQNFSPRVDGSNSPEGFMKWTRQLMFISLFSTFVVFSGFVLHHIFISNVEIDFHEYYLTPYKAKTPFVIFDTLFIPLCFSLFLLGLTSLKHKFWVYFCTIGVFTCLFANYYANTKNGIVILVISFVIFGLRLIFYAIKNKKISLWGGACLLVLCASFAYGFTAHVKRNTAWVNLISDISVAYDIDQELWWRNDKVCCIPINKNGVPVNVSTYQRVAWFVAGSKLLIENPLGYGLLHHSFGSLAKNKWPDFSEPIGDMRGATHSGLLDFALGLGIPGLILILLPLLISWVRSLHKTDLWLFYASNSIPLVLFGYLISEANEAHFSELLFFIVAFFCGLTTSHRPIKRNNN